MLRINALVQGLWYFVQPPLTSLGLAASIAAEAASQELRGAPLLNMLHVKAASVSGMFCQAFMTEVPKLPLPLQRHQTCGSFLIFVLADPRCQAHDTAYCSNPV